MADGAARGWGTLWTHQYRCRGLGDPHVVERGFIVELEHPALGIVQIAGDTVHLSDTPLSYRRHPPRLGEHSDEVAAELGYAADDIAQLRADGVLA